MLIYLRWPRNMIEELVGKVLDNSEDLFAEMEDKEGMHIDINICIAVR